MILDHVVVDLVERAMARHDRGIERQRRFALRLGQRHQLDRAVDELLCARGLQPVDPLIPAFDLGEAAARVDFGAQVADILAGRGDLALDRGQLGALGRHGLRDHVKGECGGADAAGPDHLSEARRDHP